MAPSSPSYKVRDTDAEGRPVTGIDHPGGHAEPGDTISGLTSSAVKWLTEQGYIEPAKPGRKKG